MASTVLEPAVTWNVPLAVNVWYLYPPEVTIVPPVAVNGCTGVTELDAELAVESPLAFVATTVNV
jgi:hypothetical protein